MKKHLSPEVTAAQRLRIRTLDPNQLDVNPNHVTLGKLLNLSEPQHLNG